MMMVAFQRRIIYLPSVPPGARNESLAPGERSPALAADLAGLDCRQVTVRSDVPTRVLRRPVILQGLVVSSSRDVAHSAQASSDEADTPNSPDVAVVYLSGNAGTPLLRLPIFRRLVSPAQKSATHGGSKGRLRCSVIAFAPRTYWLSTRTTPTEKGILADYAAAVRFARETYPQAKTILYGHSLGGAAAIKMVLSREFPDVAGLILENPLPSIPFMVEALYPQKWLPYRYLGPFAFDRWDAMGDIGKMSHPKGGEVDHKSASEEGGRNPANWQLPTLWIRSGRDEIIPASGNEEGTADGVESMYQSWQKCVPDSKYIMVDGALHDTAFQSKAWFRAMHDFLNIIAAR